jgi:DNA polymerase/3'-5' exonuclease PolX
LNIYKNKNVGIGKGIISRVDEILKYGYLKEIKKVIIKNKFFKKLENIYGFGKYLINKLINKYKIRSISQLKKYVKKKIIILSKNANIGLKYYKKIKKNVSRKKIKKIIKNIKKVINNNFKSLKIKICGSYRRKKEYINDIDILITLKKKSKKKIKL